MKGNYTMLAIGLLLTFLGFVVSVLSLGMTSSVAMRMSMVLFGIALNLAGIVGVINRAFMKNAIWKK